MRQELLDFAQKGFWTVSPWPLVKTHKRMLRILKISPMDIVPQQARRCQFIVNCSCFDLHPATPELASKEAKQFGKALKRILLAKIVAANPAPGSVEEQAKVDIAEGFC